MKIAKSTEEFELDTGDLESGEATISAEDIAFAFSIVSEGFYSDIYGSIVREVTSNCIDAHEAVNSQEPVRIKFHNKEGVYFISFIDVGVGMDKDEFIKIFMSYFKSTKRESNKFLGAFGVGSKSPLGYVDSFDIISRKDGIERNFILYKVPDKAPSYTILSEKETDLPNGTEIRITIPDDANYYGEYSKFKKAIRNQLAYFDNVVVEGEYFNNHYQIFEGKYFKYRAGGEESDFTNLHICLGRVTYPINYAKLGIREINCPIGIKFEIGELLVTKNRENLRYDDEEINELIKTRINEALNELGEIYNKQLNSIDSLKDYLTSHKVTSKYIQFGDNEVELPYQININSSGNSRKEYRIKSLKDVYYTPFDNLPIKIPRNPFFILKACRVFSNPRSKKPEYYQDDDLFNDIIKGYSYQGKFFRTSNPKIQNKEIDNFLEFEYVNEGYNKIILIEYPKLIPKTKSISLRKEAFDNLSKKLGLVDVDDLRKFRKCNIFREDGINSKRLPLNTYPVITNEYNKTKLFITYKKAILKEAKELIPRYEDVTFSERYENFLKDKKEIQEHIKKSGTIKVENPRTNVTKDVTMEGLTKAPLLIYYDKTESKSLIRFLVSTCYLLNNKHNNRIQFAGVGKRVYKQISKLKRPNMLTPEQFMSEDNKAFKRIVTTLYISDRFLKIKNNNYLSDTLLSEIRPDLYIIYEELSELTKNSNSILTRLMSNLDTKEILRQIIKLAESGFVNQIYLDKIKTLEVFYNDLEIFNYINESILENTIEKSKLKKTSINLMKNLKKKLHVRHYITLNDEDLKYINAFYHATRSLEA